MIEVLVVEDDFMVAKIHRGFVDAVDGFRVVGSANCGEQALTAAAELQPGLVVLDLYLPDMLGLEVIPRLRTAGHDCDVLVISAAREAEAVRGAVRHGLVDYLLKPFDADDLKERLERCGARRGNPHAVQVSGQADVDRALGRVTAPTVTPALPKGMSVETAELVERTLRAADGNLSAAECATPAGISRVSARRYLEYLSATGRAMVSLRYGHAGRPERRYHWHA
ncbi:response regulator [Streptomyces sp. NPDC060223]|uniref:response regulator n=1 Tax=unclassified Streptomyces TaxID=2593676 RepID=UPI0036378A70